MPRDDDDDIDADRDEEYRRRRERRRYRDRDDADEDDVDRDADEAYRRRTARYGAEVTDADEEEAEKDEAESERVAGRKCLWPGLLMILAGVAAVVGNVIFALVNIPTPGAGAGPGAGVTMTVFVLQWGLPLTAGVVFAAFQIIGGVCLVRRRVRGMAVTGAILGVLPCSVGLILGLPAVIWMFVALSDPDVQASFERRKKGG